MKQAKAVAAFLPLAVVAFPATAIAEQPADFRPGFYLGGSVGRSELKDTCPGCDDNDTAWKGFAGYQFNRNLGVELGYQDFGTFTSHEARAAELVGVGTIPITPSLGIFGKAGVYGYEFDNRLTGISDNGRELTYGVGLRYNFTRAVAGRLEWQRYMDMGNLTTGESDVDVLGVGVQVQF